MEGEIEIICGNSAEVLSEIGDRCVDMVVTSPPYDDLRSYGGSSDYNAEVFRSIARHLFRVMNDGSVMVWVTGDQTKNGSESGTSFRTALEFMDIGFRLHDTMIYKKRNYIPLTHNRYEQAFEYMFIFSKGRPKTFNPIMVPCKGAGKLESYGAERRRYIDKKQAMRSPDGIEFKRTKSTKIHPNVFEYSLGSAKTGHPAPFPDKLAEDMVLTWSEEGDLVLDPFCGSGTVGVACAKFGRRFFGIDIVEDYCSIARDRIAGVQTKMNL